MALTQEQIAERDPTAIQQEILIIEAEMFAKQAKYNELTETHLEARKNFEVMKSYLNHLKERRKCLNGVLGSLK